MRLYTKRLLCYVTLTLLIVCHLALLRYSVIRSPEAEQGSSPELNPSSRKLSFLPEFLEHGRFHRFANSNDSLKSTKSNSEYNRTGHRVGEQLRAPSIADQDEQKHVYTPSTIKQPRGRDPGSLGFIALRDKKITNATEKQDYRSLKLTVMPPSPSQIHLNAMDGLGNSDRSADKDKTRNDVKVASPDGDYITSHSMRYTFNCSNIDRIRIKRKLGHGVTKQVYLGTIGDDQVAVKMVTRNVMDVTSCLKANQQERDLNSLPSKPEDVDASKLKCYVFPNMKLMKEILIMEQIHHANLIKMLGYCVRNEETESTSLQEHGVIAVYEYCQRFYVNSLSTWSLRDRLKTAMEMADLLNYFEHSPLGSLRVSDFKENHFLLREGRVKLTDLDDLTSSEPSCTIPQPYPIAKLDYTGNRMREETITATAVPDERRLCHYGLSCQGGICPGHNAKFNLDNMNRILFKNLLAVEGNLDMDTHIIGGLISLKYDLDRLKVTAYEVIVRLQILLNHPELPL